jgi:signal transduction histidine kinase/DNA-binding response OmpR family regulator
MAGKTVAASADAQVANLAAIFPGDSEMARLMRAKDWEQTALGATAQWPQSLRTAVGICLSSRFPILIWWGAELVMLYNDAYRTILGAKHPDSLGAEGRHVWPEIWHIIGPMLEGVLHESRATWSDDQFLPLERNGYREECYFTFSYSPIQDESGSVAGVFCAVTETTTRVLSARRAQSARELAAAVLDAHSAEALCTRAMQILASATADVPFAALYLLDQEPHLVRLAASTGLDGDDTGAALAPPRVDLASASEATLTGIESALARAARTNQRVQVTLAPPKRDAASLPAERQPSPRRVLVTPIAQPGKTTPSAILLAGVSPMRELDDGYQAYFDLLVSHLSASFAAAAAYEEERKRAEALAAIDRAKTAFFSNVSHEFRTPLTLILGPLSDLLADEHDLSPDVRGQIELIHRNGLRLSRLVNMLLDFSRIEAGRVEALYVPTDLGELTGALASVFRSLIERAGLRFEVDCPPLEALAEPVYVDRDMWEKIVLNLLSNAFKFTLEGTIRVSLRAVEASNAVELEVCDTGIGIVASELPRVFERFHRIQSAQARAYEGSGIGLALVRELVHLHGGTIRLESIEGAGTSIFVRLPTGSAHLPAEHVHDHLTFASTTLAAESYVREAERWLPGDSAGGSRPLVPAIPAATGAPIPPHSMATEHPTEPRARVLLADDNADMRDYLRRLLSTRYTVEAVHDGAAALAAIRRQAPDLVLADAMMPQMNGFELLRAVRGDPATRVIPVILLSAQAGEEASIEGLEAGADDYLTKPFSAREVLSRIAARLEIARARREAEARARELELTFEAITDAAFIYDREGRIVRMNPAAYALYGLEPTSHFAKLPPEQRAALISARDDQGRPIPAQESGLARLLRGESLTGANALDVRLRVADGSEHEISVTGGPLRDESGAVIGAVAISRDVTERRRLERQTHETLEALLQIVRALVTAPQETDAADREMLGGGIVELVRSIFPVRYATLLTASSDDTPGAETLQLMAASGYTPEQEALLHERNGRVPLSARILDADERKRLLAGETIIMDLNRPLYAEQRRLFGATRGVIVPMRIGERFIGALGLNPHEHITLSERELALAEGVAQMAALVIERDRLLSERELERARILALQDANRRMNDFLGIASHELRTPLTSIIGNVQMSERVLRPFAAATADPTDVPDDLAAKLQHTHDMLMRADRQLSRLDRLVGDLLDVSRIEAGKLELRRELCDLTTVVREAVDTQRPAWPRRVIALHLPRRASAAVWADADRIGQVVANYVTNALKYSHDDQPVAVCLLRRSGRIRVEVHDHGPGLSEEQRAHLFERFSRAEGITQLSGSGVGLGLGLYICRTIVERHDGTFGVTSTPGEGSTFWFELPPASRRMARHSH